MRGARAKFLKAWYQDAYGRPPNKSQWQPQKDRLGLKILGWKVQVSEWRVLKDLWKTFRREGRLWPTKNSPSSNDSAR